MDGTLHDLVELIMYSKEDEPFCQIYFGGRSEPYDTVKADELLGDIIELSSLDLSDIFDAHQKKYIETNCKDNLIEIKDKCYLEVAAAIVECYPRNQDTWMDHSDVLEMGMELGWKTTDIIDDTVTFVKLLAKNKIRLTRETLDQFNYAYLNYIPPCSKILDYRKYIGKKDINQLAIKENIFDENDDLENLLLQDKSTPYALFIYECDLMVEVIMALLHYLSAYKSLLSICKTCGRIFMPIKRSDEKYCTRSFNSDCCRNIGRKNVRRNRLQHDYVAKKYNSVCTNLSNRIYATKIRNDPNEQEKRRQTLEQFRIEFQEKKIKLSEDKLLSWMDSWLQRQQKISH